MLGSVLKMATGQTSISEIVKEKLGDIVDSQSERFDIPTDETRILITKINGEVHISVFDSVEFKAYLSQKEIEEIIKR